MRLRRFAGCLFLLFCLGSKVQAQPVSPWAEDMDAFVEVLLKAHPNPYHTTSKEDFFRAVNAYKEAVQDMPYGRKVIEFARVVALVGDGHTFMPLLPIPFENAPPGPQFQLLPVRMELFEDGLFIVGADEDHKNLIGGKITAIGDVPFDEAWEMAATLAPVSTPRLGMEFVPNWLTSPNVLYALGLSETPTEAILSLEKDGEWFKAHLSALPPEHQLDWIWSYDGGPDGVTPWLTGGPSGDDTPLWLQNTTQQIWYTELPAMSHRGGVYLQINEIQDVPEGAFNELLAEVFNDLTAQDDPALVIDLRLCLGGDGSINYFLVDRIAAMPALNRPGRVYVLTSHRTFSAAVMMVSSLAQNTEARFVGTPTGDRPNHYGETNFFILPNSGLPVLHSSLYHQTSTPDDDRLWQSPDIFAPIHYTDYAAGRDPGLEAVLNDMKEYD